MVYTQKIGYVKFYFNNSGRAFNLEERKKLYNEFEKLFKAKYEDSEYKKALYFDCTYSDKGDFIVTIQINILYCGIYQTIINYGFIFPFLLQIIEGFKNINIKSDAFSSDVAVMDSNLITIHNLKPIIEKSGAYIMKENNDGKFSLFQTEDEVISSVSKSINNNFHFLNCHRKTEFHEIDPKVIEARLCIAYGLNNASITMIIIALEEALKTILKYDYIKKNRQTDKEPSLQESEDLTKKAQRKFGSLPLSKCITNASHSHLITDDEETLLNDINEKLRSAIFHSDKSKMYSNDKTEITFVKSDLKTVKKVESKQMSAKDLIYIQGILQFKLADKYAKDIFNEIEELIFNISTRYWKDNKELIEKIKAT